MACALCAGHGGRHDGLPHMPAAETQEALREAQEAMKQLPMPETNQPTPAAA